MTGKNLTTLERMRSGQSGMVVKVEAGHGLASRLNALGIRSGKRIRKVSSMMMRGPVTIQVDGTHVALGFGMARRVIVEIMESVL